MYCYLTVGNLGICGSPDFFQEKMTGLMQSLNYIRCYIDDLLIISKNSYADHLGKLREVLRRLLNAGLRVNAAKSFFATGDRVSRIHTYPRRHQASTGKVHGNISSKKT